MMLTCVKCHREGIDVSMRHTEDGCVCHLCSPEGVSTDVMEALTAEQGSTLFLHTSPTSFSASIVHGDKDFHFRLRNGQFAMWGGKRNKVLPGGSNV